MHDRKTAFSFFPVFLILGLHFASHPSIVEKLSFGAQSTKNNSYFVLTFQSDDDMMIKLSLRGCKLCGER
ncbi:hypothetical protein, partial [Bhargavaea beijingensis]|uniref:hypothetical protein n=1 Tax=Bhargavaea beijingensis TaxID=426756 RepID=UPI0022243B47